MEWEWLSGKLSVDRKKAGLLSRFHPLFGQRVVHNINISVQEA